MDTATLSSIVLLLLIFGFLASGVWIAVALLATGTIVMALFSQAPTGSLIASTIWNSSWGWALTSLPLFIWMGEILFRSRLSTDMFKGLSPLAQRFPGGLLHVNIAGCGVLAAITGSSAVTCATIGRMTEPELSRRGYPLNMTIGTLAGSGTMGLLIPPSIVMIVYGVTADVSIGRMFIAGIVPGIILVGLYMTYTGIWCLANPSKMPARERSISIWADIRSLWSLLPAVTLIVVVIGSIYGGYTTPTEAATVGVLGALLLSILGRSLTWTSFVDGLMATVRMSCMIAFIIACAACLSIAVAYIDLPGTLAEWVASLHLSRYVLLLVLAVLMIVLGCFIDGISIIVLTSPVVLPMVQAAGIDLIWFGIFLVILIEAAQITPPVGFNLFVMQSITGEDIVTVAKAAFPYFLLLMVLLVFLVIEPNLALWLVKGAF